MIESSVWVKWNYFHILSWLNYFAHFAKCRNAQKSTACVEYQQAIVVVQLTENNENERRRRAKSLLNLVLNCERSKSNWKCEQFETEMPAIKIRILLHISILWLFFSVCYGWVTWSSNRRKCRTHKSKCEKINCFHL